MKKEEAHKLAKKIDTDVKKENKILKGWITRNYSSRCPDYAKDCACCKAWKCYDFLVME